MLKKGKAFPSSNRNPTKTEEYHDFRGYAGKLYGNNIKGDVVTVLPSLTESVVTNIHFFDKQFEEAAVGFDYQIRNDINVTRGDMIVKSSELPKVEKDINTTVCWMDSKKLVPGAKICSTQYTTEF
jgi:sulfate adenylyltransferase subunit 1